MSVSTETTRAFCSRPATICKGASSASTPSAVRSLICGSVISKSWLPLGRWECGWGACFRNLLVWCQGESTCQGNGKCGLLSPAQQGKPASPVHGVEKSQTPLSDWTEHNTCVPFLPRHTVLYRSPTHARAIWRFSRQLIKRRGGAHESPFPFNDFVLDVVAVLVDIQGL